MVSKAGKANSRATRGIKNCRVLDLGISNFAECLKPGPSTCSYAVPFGYCFLCNHPQVNKLIENTKKTRLVAEAWK